jgi:deoxyribonuclease V
VVFTAWEDAAPAAEYTAAVGSIEPYIPGQFFRRELPCLLAAIAKIAEPIDTLIIDGYVTLAAQPGLGRHLYDALQQKIPVIGVAKTRFAGAPAVQLFRGRSASPSFITAIGIDPATAANNIRHMHGPHRIPTLLKRVDRLARDG